MRAGPQTIQRRFRTASIILCMSGAILVWGIPVPAAEPRVFSGSDTFQTAILPPTSLAGCPNTDHTVSTSDAGSGNSSLLGRYSFTAGECIDLTTLDISLGFFTLTAADGLTITGNYAGTAQYTDSTHSSVLYAVAGFITGGTGRFQNVTTGTAAWLGGATFTSASTATGFDTVLTGDLYTSP